jgi:hypothetical protein
MVMLAISIANLGYQVAIKWLPQMMCCLNDPIVMSLPTIASCHSISPKRRHLFSLSLQLHHLTPTKLRHSTQELSMTAIQWIGLSENRNRKP